MVYKSLILIVIFIYDESKKKEQERKERTGGGKERRARQREIKQTANRAVSHTVWLFILVPPLSPDQTHHTQSLLRKIITTSLVLNQEDGPAA